MNETTKTCIFVALAVVALGAAWLGRPQPLGVQVPDQVGQPLFPEFTDPFMARGLEISSFNTSVNELQTFKVAQKDGKWVIPSREDYPADAAESLKQAATLLVDLTVLGVVSDRREDHKQFGVVEPTEETSLGDSGVGKRVAFRGEKGERLAELIIGLPVRGSDDQHYVRIPGKDRVYIVKIDPEKLSTRFEDWVKSDLLELNTFDIEEMELRDYSSDPVMTSEGLDLRIAERFRATVAWDSKDYKWVLKDLREYRGRKFTPRELGPDEELNGANLDAMKDALGELKLVDVRKKPPGLRPSEASQSNIFSDRESLISLIEHGFYPGRNRDGSLKLYCSDGEVDVRTKDGIQYTLWFGKQAATVDAKGETKLNRFAMISAKVRENFFKKPKLELPPTASSTPVPPQQEETASPETPSEQTTQEPGNLRSVDQANPPPGDVQDEASTRSAPSDAAQGANPAETGDANDEERSRLIKEYERKLEEYKEKVQQAEKKARLLNNRLGDWYYVVSEEIYGKLHLSQGKIVTRKKADQEQEAGVDAFRRLEAEGLKPTS